MLVLSRKIGDRIFIGPDVCITVTEIMYGKVRFGIEAPRGVEIFREEIAPDDHPLLPRNRKKPGGNSANDGN